MPYPKREMRRLVSEVTKSPNDGHLFMTVSGSQDACRRRPMEGPGDRAWGLSLGSCSSKSGGSLGIFRRQSLQGVERVGWLREREREREGHVRTEGPFSSTESIFTGRILRGTAQKRILQ